MKADTLWHTLEFEFTYACPGMGTFASNNLSGVGKPSKDVISVAGKEVARNKMDKTIPITLAWDKAQKSPAEWARLFLF